MSKISVISLDDRMVYAYDVGRSILLAKIIHVAEVGDATSKPPWLAERLQRLRVLALVADYGFSIDSDWPLDARDLLVSLVGEASRQLAERTAITPEEVAEWASADTEEVPWRGTEPEPTGPVVQIGTAITQLIRGSLPPDPPGNKRWCFGFAE